MRTEFLSQNTTADTPKIRTRRSVGDRVAEALQQLSDGHAILVRHKEKAWASITFAGTRHQITLEFNTPAAIEAGEQLIADLPDHEFAIPRQLVAEATIGSVDHCLHPQPKLTVNVTLLLLEEA